MQRRPLLSRDFNKKTETSTAKAAEAADAEIEAIMREDVAWSLKSTLSNLFMRPLFLPKVLRRALLDPEGEARRRRVQARSPRACTIHHNSKVCLPFYCIFKQSTLQYFVSSKDKARRRQGRRDHSFLLALWVIICNHK